MKAGLFSPEKIKSTKINDLEKLIPESHAKSLKDALDERKGGKGKSFFQLNKRAFPQILFEGTPVRDRFLILVDGQRVALSAKSFGYLVKLAWAAFVKEGGWLHKLDLESGDNQAKYIYRLKRELSPFLNKEKILIQNNRLGFYRLNIPKGKIEFNFKNLNQHLDADLRNILSFFEKDKKVIAECGT